MVKTDPEATSTEKRQANAAHVLASIAAFFGAVLLIVAVRFLTDVEQGIKVVGFIGLAWLFRGFGDHILKLGDQLEKWFGWNRDSVQTPASPSKSPDQIHWWTVTAWIFTFMTFGLVYGLARFGIPEPLPHSLKTKPRMYSIGEIDDVRKIIATESAITGKASQHYWQTAVANLHAIRFETPSGKESFEKYQERMFQQLRSLTSTARSTSTANVDAELIQLATRHLTVDEQYLELKISMDSLMQQERLPSPKDSVDQRMELTQVILNLLATNPEAVEALPAGPERDLVEKGLELEQTRQGQFREIEIMQATLQERYKGTAFPLPTINQP